MYDLEEQEQIDELKAWWKEHGRIVVAVGMAIVLAAAGTAAWQWYKRSQSEQASQLYGVFEKALRANDLKQIREVSAQIKDKYGGTAYGPMAALAAAKANYESGDGKAAAADLQWTIDNARDDDMSASARVRLAGVLLDEKKYDEALKLLDSAHPDAFTGLFADMKGDVLVAQGKSAEARAAYKLALEKLPAEGNYRVMVQVKLDGLGGDK